MVVKKGKRSFTVEKDNCTIDEVELLELLKMGAVKGRDICCTDLTLACSIFSFLFLQQGALPFLVLIYRFLGTSFDLLNSVRSWLHLRS